MSPTQLSRELRTADTPGLQRRRSVVALSNVGALAGIVVGLYQTGVISHLPAQLEREEGARPAVRALAGANPRGVRAVERPPFSRPSSS